MQAITNVFTSISKKVSSQQVAANQLLYPTTQRSDSSSPAAQLAITPTSSTGSFEIDSPTSAATHKPKTACSYVQNHKKTIGCTIIGSLAVGTASYILIDRFNSSITAYATVNGTHPNQSFQPPLPSPSTLPLLPPSASLSLLPSSPSEAPPALPPSSPPSPPTPTPTPSTPKPSPSPPADKNWATNRKLAKEYCQIMAENYTLDIVELSCQSPEKITQPSPATYLQGFGYPRKFVQNYLPQLNPYFINIGTQYAPAGVLLPLYQLNNETYPHFLELSRKLITEESEDEYVGVKREYYKNITLRDLFQQNLAKQITQSLKMLLDENPFSLYEYLSNVTNTTHFLDQFQRAFEPGAGYNPLAHYVGDFEMVGFDIPDMALNNISQNQRVRGHVHNGPETVDGSFYCVSQYIDTKTGKIIGHTLVEPNRSLWLDYVQDNLNSLNEKISDGDSSWALPLTKPLDQTPAKQSIFWTPSSPHASMILRPAELLAEDIKHVTWVNMCAEHRDIAYTEHSVRRHLLEAYKKRDGNPIPLYDKKGLLNKR